MYSTELHKILDHLPATLPEVTESIDECFDPKQWSMFDGMATEVEVLQFIYSLVKTLKPSICIETGTYKGFGSICIGQALKENDKGILITTEPDMNLAADATNLIMKFGLTDYVNVKCVKGIELITSIKSRVDFAFRDYVDFAFLDSNVDTRMPELIAVNQILSASGVIAIHDTSTYHNKHHGLRTSVIDFAHKYSLQYFQFDTPRGLTLLRH